MGREIIYTAVGGPQMNSANCKLANSKSANLRTYKIWYICRPSANVAICGFVDPIFFKGLKLPQIRKFFIFLLTNIYLKCGFAICVLVNRHLQIRNLSTRIPQKFADLRLRIEPKNVRICDLQTLNKICAPTFGD